VPPAAPRLGVTLIAWRMPSFVPRDARLLFWVSWYFRPLPAVRRLVTKNHLEAGASPKAAADDNSQISSTRDT